MHDFEFCFTYLKCFFSLIDLIHNYSHWFIASGHAAISPNSDSLFSVNVWNFADFPTVSYVIINGSEMVEFRNQWWTQLWLKQSNIHNYRMHEMCVSAVACLREEEKKRGDLLKRVWAIACVCVFFVINEPMFVFVIWTECRNQSEPNFRTPHCGCLFLDQFHTLRCLRLK